MRYKTPSHISDKTIEFIQKHKNERMHGLATI